MTNEHSHAFASIRARQGLIAAGLLSAGLWLVLIVVARIATHLV